MPKGNWHGTCSEPVGPVGMNAADGAPETPQHRPYIVMENASFVALSRQMALRLDLDAAANNMANANTPGYKTVRSLFVEQLVGGGSSAPGASQPLSMVLDQATVRDLRPGRLEQTEDPFNVAIMGEGYLVVETPLGPRYTRNGQITRDLEGRLVDINGLPLLDDGNQPIEVPGDVSQLTIDRDGQISTDQGPAGRLAIVRFDNEAAMAPLGGGLLVTNEVPKPAEDSELVQGMLEQSNVQPIVEMTELVRISKEYQSAQRLIQSEHERQRTAIERLGRMQTA